MHGICQSNARDVMTWQIAERLGGEGVEISGGSGGALPAPPLQGAEWQGEGGAGKASWQGRPAPPAGCRKIVHVYYKLETAK